MPGDPAHEVAGTYATTDQIAAVRERLGLDKPILVQYGLYLTRLMHADLGVSLSTKQNVAKELQIYFPATLELGLASMFIVVLVGVPIGVLTGTGRFRGINTFAMFSAVAAAGMPVFVSGLVLQIIFFGILDWLPISGRLSSDFQPPPSLTRMYTLDAFIAGQWATFGNASLHILLPAVTLAIPSIAATARITHASMQATLRMDYIRTARAKGAPFHIVLLRHALKNALLPVVTLIAMQAGWLLSGSIIVENIFSWGGLGTYAWVGIFRLDQPVIMGITLVTTLTFVFLNFIADVSYAYLDPRISYE